MTNLTQRPIAQKEPRIKGSLLRASAQLCPKCMSCGKLNYDGHQLCLAHSNRIQDGKGRGIKSHDQKGAIVCDACHGLIDGRTGKLDRYQMQAMHESAHVKTLKWWLLDGYL